MISAEETNEVFHCLEIAWTKFDGLQPVLFSLFTPVKTKKGGCKIRDRLDMSILEVSKGGQDVATEMSLL